MHKSISLESNLHTVVFVPARFILGKEACPRDRAARRGWLWQQKHSGLGQEHASDVTLPIVLTDHALVSECTSWIPFG